MNQNYRGPWQAKTILDQCPSDDHDWMVDEDILINIRLSGEMQQLPANLLYITKNQIRMTDF